MEKTQTEYFIEYLPDESKMINLKSRKNISILKYYILSHQTLITHVEFEKASRHDSAAIIPTIEKATSN